MLLEPPGADLPGDAEPIASPFGTVRLIAGGAAAAVAVTTVGPIAGLVVLVAVALTTVAGAGVAALAGLALGWRWSTGSLAAVAGAQGVLGPGLVVGPAAGALASMLVAVAMVVVTPGTATLVWPSLGPALATGSVAALAVAGMAGVPALRVLCTLAGVGAALAAGRLPWPRERVIVGLGAAAVAVLLAPVR
ncbi:MAG: hypothetical protein JF603_14185 [Acidobacteria bacterium]|nr:hypothetical protein [Acidobacteriota bacterium]